MSGTGTAGRLLRQRAAAQLLGPAAATRPADVVRRVVAVQAQDVRAARLAVRARTDGVTATDVDAVCSSGELARTWLMRGTLHMVLAGDVRWLLRIFGARNAGAGRGRRRTLGLDDGLCERAFAALPDILHGTALRRDEVVARLGRHGVELDPRSQAPAHLMMYAASRGLVCRGPETAADEPTYALLHDVLHDGLDDGSASPGTATDDDLARLADRYLAGYGPAAPQDLAGWSGLPVTVARTAFAAIGAGSVGSASAGGGEPAGDVAARTRLLGHFDAYLLGYAGRDAAVPAEHAHRLQSGGGFVMPAVAVGGRVVATWSSSRRAAGLTVTVEPFGGPLPAEVRDALPGEVADLGRFLRTSAELAG